MNDDQFALAQTVDDGAGRTTAQSDGAFTLQSSVLPRVTLVDGMPTFSSQHRPRFVFAEQLGEGGVGKVVRAHDEDIGRSVAIKRLRDGTSASTTSVARFVEEMRVTGGLDHPNVVPVHDVGVDAQGDFFFVMRHVRGETLESILGRLAADDPETHRLYGVERRVEIFKSVLEAIAYAHSRGIVHRDIKPANIMVGPFGEVVVMDWGVAKSLHQDDDLARLGDAQAAADGEGLERAFQTQAGALVGTPLYMAPEQVRAQPVDARTDIYALSVVFHEMLYLEHYLASKTNLVDVCYGVVHEPLQWTRRTASSLQATVPAELYWFVELGMRKEPEHRYQSVQEMIDRLERRAAGDIDVQCPYTATRSLTYRLVRLSDRHPGALMIAGVLIILLLLAAIGAVII